MGVEYASSKPDISPELRAKILESVMEDASKKPWNLIDTVVEAEDFSEDEARAALKELTLEGELQITAAGEVRAPPSTA
ncbi:hypothetical protein G9463_10280 [Haloarcula sp. JP-Z28]|uniref:hypothetical protein n=1 Tax=Haloarcula sp. JP-Z28 TaxID=2716715 RepID=UPI0014053ED8|nr:hypothetical protein [Haloarcula sp. JP-Z28]NHN63681.1 hypothetical protein [Haloarcula sp. JP-Z28]